MDSSWQVNLTLHSRAVAGRWGSDSLRFPVWDVQKGRGSNIRVHPTNPSTLLTQYNLD